MSGIYTQNRVAMYDFIRHINKLYIILTPNGKFYNKIQLSIHTDARSIFDILGIHHKVKYYKFIFSGCKITILILNNKID